MRRTNLCTKPAETLDALAGNPSNWRDFKNGTKMSLQPGQYVASCNVTEHGSKNAAIQYWDETHHVQLGSVWNGVIGVNVMRIDVQTASDKCNFSACGCRATDFIVERADTHALASGGGVGSRPSSPQAPRRTELEAGGRMRIRNLYDPPTMDDRAPVTPWAPSVITASSKTTDEGCEITTTGKGWCWLYPPEPYPDGLANVVWQKKDGSYLVGIDNMTVPIPEGVTVLTRLCGFNDRSLVTLLQNAGLPLVFAATDHPY